MGLKPLLEPCQFKRLVGIKPEELKYPRPVVKTARRRAKRDLKARRADTFVASQVFRSVNSFECGGPSGLSASNSIENRGL